MVITMKTGDLELSILKALHRNQIAIAAAIDELALWAETIGSRKTAETVKGILDTMNHDDNLIDVSISLLDSETP